VRSLRRNSSSGVACWNTPASRGSLIVEAAGCPAAFDVSRYLFLFSRIQNRSDLHPVFTCGSYGSSRTEGKEPIVSPLGEKRPGIPTLILVLAGVVLVAVTLFRVPLATVFTLGLVLICPLLMVGMHGGHHRAGRTSAHETGCDAVDVEHESREMRHLGPTWTSLDHLDHGRTKDQGGGVPS
jgi:hypothetical protein